MQHAAATVNISRVCDHSDTVSALQRPTQSARAELYIELAEPGPSHLFCVCHLALQCLTLLGPNENLLPTVRFRFIQRAFKIQCRSKQGRFLLIHSTTSFLLARRIFSLFTQECGVHRARSPIGAIGLSTRFGLCCLTARGVAFESTECLRRGARAPGAFRSGSVRTVFGAFSWIPVLAGHAGRRSHWRFRAAAVGA